MRLFGPIKLKLILGGLGALLLAGVAVGVTANAAGVLPAGLMAATQPTPSTGQRGLWCQDYLGHLAADLGITADKLRSAGLQAADQTIDDAVKAGKLTPARAATLKQRLASHQQACSFGRGVLGGFHGRGAGMQLVVQAAAKTLNLTPEQLKTDLMQGKTLSSLAGGMTEDQFRATFLKNLKAELDQQVSQGKLTQDRENALLQRLQTAPIPFWNQPVGQGMGRMGHGGFFGGGGTGG